MKIILTIIIFSLSQSLVAQEGNSSEILKKNKVKSCTYKICMGNGEDSNCFGNYEEYNKNGQLTLEHPRRSSTSYFSDYDDNGNKFQRGWVQNQKRDTLEWFEYDDKNNLVLSFHSEDSTFYYNQYNEKGLLTATIICRDDLMINEGDYLIYEYDDHGNKINEEHFTNHQFEEKFQWFYNQNKILYKYKYTYPEFDFITEIVYHPDDRIKSSIESFEDPCLGIFGVFSFEYRYFDNGLISQKISDGLVFDFEYEYW